MGLKVIITGASGMVGRGVLLECLESAHVDAVTIVNRRSLEMKHPKLTELILADFNDCDSLTLSGYDACYFCLGVSVLGLNEAQYKAITYDLTMKFARHLVQDSSGAVFCYVSGAGTNANSSTMWSRIKGQTEEDVKSLPFKEVFLFRPGYIQPLKGIRSKTKLYNALYVLLRPLAGLIKSIFKSAVTDTTSVGQAMINATVYGWPHQVLDNKSINQLAAQPTKT